MQEELHDLIHLIANMVRDMQEHEKKICDFMDKWVKKDEENKEIKNEPPRVG